MGVRGNFSQRGGNVEILLILFRLLTTQCKRTFTKRFTFLLHSLFWLNLIYQSIVRSVFYTSAIRNTFSFLKTA